MKHIVVFICLIPLLAIGQSKFEKEYRLKKEDVPVVATNFIEKIDHKRNLKWYKEESSDGKTVEAKFKVNKVAYSVEFDTTGNLLDIEELIRVTDLDIFLQQDIKNQLQKRFIKFKVVKIQKQLKGENHELITYFKKSNDKNVSGYELVVKGKKNKELNLYELFFNGSGEVESELIIVIKSGVHLEY